MVMTLPDGRQLGYARYGAADGIPLLYLHGLPGSRLECMLIDKPALELGISVVAVDRPGYGLSSPADASLEAWAGDIGHLLKQLAWSDILVIGVSGGGPHALACARYLGNQVRVVGLVAGLGPVSERRLLSQMGVMERLGFWLGRHAAGLFAIFAGLPLTWLARHRTNWLIQLLAFINAPSDQQCLRQPDIHNALMSSLPECFVQRATGALADLQRVQVDWAATLGNITVPVRLWHGTADRVVPPGHSRYIEQALPRAKLEIVPDAGHFSLPYAHMETLLADLVTSSGLANV